MINGSRLSQYREAWGRILHLTGLIARDPLVGHKARFLLIILGFFLITINGLNVVISYVARDFMTAIADHDRERFHIMTLAYIGVFAAMTVASVMQRFAEESLGLLSRNWLTWRSFSFYADHRVYLRLEEDRTLENPDQRIAEDVKTFTATSLSFLIMLLNSVLTAFAFSGVLWSISPQLFWVAVAYAVVGTWLTIQLGRPLIHLNYDQLDKEANFRASLIHLRDKSEPLALSRREAFWIERIRTLLNSLTSNYRNIVRANRNVGFFTTGYNWMIQIIPALMIAPLFIDGRVEFGVITQSAVAFTQLLGAFSLIVTQFQSISSFAAVVARLHLLAETVNVARRTDIAACREATTNWRPGEPISLVDVNLANHQGDGWLIKNLTVDFRQGQRIRICCSDPEARSALIHAMAGIRPVSQGTLTRPPLEKVMFVPEIPYLCPTTLREIFLRPHPDLANGLSAPIEPDLTTLQPDDTAIREALARVGLSELENRCGGMTRQQDWDNLLSQTEQQLLVVARVLVSAPLFVMLDRPAASFPAESLEAILMQLESVNITVIMFTDSARDTSRQDAILELFADGQWHWSASEAG